MVAVHIAFRLTERAGNGSAIFEGVTGCDTVDIVDDVFVSERIHPCFGAGEDLGLFVPGGFVLIRDGVGQIETANVAFDLTTTIGARLIGPVHTDLARYIQLGVTTFGGDAAIQELQLQGCVGEAEATLRRTIFVVVAPGTASEGEFVFLGLPRDFR